MNPQYSADFIKDVLEGLEDQSEEPPPISIHDSQVSLQIQPVAFQFSPDTSISLDQKPLKMRLTSPTSRGLASEKKGRFPHLLKNY